MRAIGNFLWFITGGITLGLLWWLLGLVAYISVIGIPWGKACFVMGHMNLFPFGKEVMSRNELTLQDDIGTGAAGIVGNVVWFLFAGWWLALFYVLAAVVNCITILGIPFGIQCLKLAGIALAPIGKTLVTKEVAAAARQANAVAVIETQRKRLASSQQEDPPHGVAFNTELFKPALLTVGGFLLLAVLLVQLMHPKAKNSDPATRETRTGSNTLAPPNTMPPMSPEQAALARRESSVTPPPILLAEEIPLIKKGGVYELPVEINGVITLHFILDTGASEVNIPADVALTLYRAGTIRDTDFLPGRTYTLADGSTLNSSRFLLRNLAIGSYRITNIPASLGEVASPLLLGQSFLERLGTWGIDGQKQVLVLGPVTTTLSQKISTPSPTMKAPPLPPSKAAGNTENNPIPTASVGLPNTKTGDTYIIEYLDPDNAQSRYSTERKVVAVGEGTITVTSKNMNSKTAKARTLQFTSEWNLLSSRNPDGSGFDYAPPLKYFAFPLSPGKTWQQTSQETSIKTGAVREYTLSATVGDWEEITVPAGTFRALKITLQTALLDRTTEQKSTSTDMSWYVPTIRRSVKSEVTSQNFQGQQERQIIQLIKHDLKEAQSPMQDGRAQASGREVRQGPETQTDSARIIPAIPVLGNAHKAVIFLTQMIALAKQNGGEGQEAQLEALKQQIEALPKPRRGDRKAARLQNDKGLEVPKTEQYEHALQFLLTAYQLDTSDAEVLNNIGFTYLKTGNLPEAARYLGGALSLAPTRATAWANLAEVYAHSTRPEDAVAAYALTYRYSKNKDTTRRYLETQTTNADDPLVMQAAKSALALALISGRTE